MKMRAAIALVWMPVALAQVPNFPAPSSPVLRTHSTLVLVPALVRTSAGELVFTLTAKDFMVTDNGIEQDVALEEDTGDQPLALVVAIETGGAGARRLDYYRKLGPMIEAVVGDVQHKVAVVGFDSVPRVLQDFTPDLNVVEGAMHDLAPGDGGAAILDSLGFSVDLLRKQPAEYRRAILLISQTIDHGSQVRLEEALRVIGDTNTAIYSFGFSTSRAELKHEASHLNSSVPGPSGGCLSTDTSPAPSSSKSRLAQTWECLSLLAPPLRAVKMAAIATMNGLRDNVPETVAQLTGGEFFRFEDTRSLERGLLTISNHIPNRYVLSFQPRSPAPGFHSIELRLRNYPDLVVTARNSYWVESEVETEASP